MKKSIVECKSKATQFSVNALRDKISVVSDYLCIYPKNDYRSFEFISPYAYHIEHTAFGFTSKVYQVVAALVVAKFMGVAEWV